MDIAIETSSNSALCVLTNHVNDIQRTNDTVVTMDIDNQSPLIQTSVELPLTPSSESILIQPLLAAPSSTQSSLQSLTPQPPHPPLSESPSQQPSSQS
jgi:hypothetical protein